jgi:hypothetical protein
VPSDFQKDCSGDPEKDVLKRERLEELALDELREIHHSKKEVWLNEGVQKRKGSERQGKKW